MRRGNLLLVLALLGCAHAHSDGLSIDEETAIQVEAFRAAILYPGTKADLRDNDGAIKQQYQSVWCLGVYDEPSGSTHIRVSDAPPRVVSNLSDEGARVLPESQCRNRGIESPLLYDGSRARIRKATLYPFHGGSQMVAVALDLGCYPDSEPSCAFGRGLLVRIGLTAAGWETTEVVSTYTE